MPLTLDDIQTIIDDILYLDWEFYVGGTTEQPWLQMRFLADGEYWHARKWKLSPFMIPSEVIRTAWLAVQQAVEHEAAEKFTYRGTTIFNPHIDLQTLAAYMDADQYGLVAERPPNQILEQEPET
jgi:hypothetical protein